MVPVDPLDGPREASQLINVEDRHLSVLVI